MSIRCLQRAIEKCIMRSWKTLSVFRFFNNKRKRRCNYTANDIGKYSVLDISRYIINSSIRFAMPVSNLKLQKILYFIQGNFYKIRDEACFKEDIHAWDYGPVVPEVYKEFKGYGSNNILKLCVITSFNMDTLHFEEKGFDESIIRNEDKEIIDGVIELCNRYNANDLVKITHKQKPWITTYQRNEDNIIDKDKIRSFFRDGNG